MNFLAEVLDEQAIAVDATMGNGNDTAFLAQHAKEVYAFLMCKNKLCKARKNV